MKASLGSVEYIASLYKSDTETKRLKEAVSTSAYGKDFVHAALSVNKKVRSVSLNCRVWITCRHPAPGYP